LEFVLEHNKFERKFQQLSFPIGIEIAIPEDDPVRMTSVQLEKPDYRELVSRLFFARKKIGRRPPDHL
jgi:hypothetical protein